MVGWVVGWVGGWVGGWLGGWLGGGDALSTDPRLTPSGRLVSNEFDQQSASYLNIFFANLTKNYPKVNESKTGWNFNAQKTYL